jgi:hypothetical protein
MKQILTLITIPVITTFLSARSFPFAFATTTHSLWFWFWPRGLEGLERAVSIITGAGTEPTAGGVQFHGRRRPSKTHHREKTNLPQSRVWNHLFPHSVLEGRSKKKAGLGSSSKPKKFSQVLKQKRGSQPLGHLKWPGAGPNELINGSGGPLKAAFWPTTFPRVRFHCPSFLPLHLFANPQLPPKNRSPGRNAGKVVRTTAKATSGAG